MRWKTINPKNGDTRRIKLFLLFPKTIKGETRWLEVAKYKQSFHYYMDGSDWEDECWIDE